MSIQVICTPYGPAATERLRKQITVLKKGDPLAPVTVVVPTNISGLGARRALGAAGRGIAAVDFLKLFDLAERLGAPNTAQPDNGRRFPLSDLEIGVAMRRALDSNPGLFQASAHHPATEQALVRSYRDLREVSDSGLDKLAAQSPRAADVVRLCRYVRSELRNKWYDGQDLVELAVEALEPKSSYMVLGEIGPVIVYLPQRVTTSQGQMILAVAEKVPVVVIAGLTGDDQADAPVAASVLRMGGTLDAKAAPSPPHAQRIITVATATEEFRVAVREVLGAARQGIPMARIAVLCGGGPPVIRQVQEQLKATGIGVNGPSGRTLADSLAGRGLLALLNLKNRDFRRDEVFALLSVAFLTVDPSRAVDPGSDPTSPAMADAKPAPVMAWERVSRRAGVARGADQWQMRLHHHADELRDKATEEQQKPDGTEGRVEWLNRQAAHADSLAEFMAQLERDLSPSPAPTTWKYWQRWVEGLIDAYLGGEAPDDDWPEPEIQAAKAIRETVARLGGLDDIEARPRTSAFLPALVSALSTPSAREGTLGKGVLVGGLGDPLGMELDRLIIIGMAEGTFPHSPSDDPLLPDRERKAAGDDLSLLADQHHDQHRSFLAALASARSTTLVYARGDSRRASEQHPSRWLLDTATALAGRRVDSANLDRLADDETCHWFEHVPSFSGRVIATEFPATDQEFRLRALATAGASANRGLPDDPTLPDDPALARGAELTAARASDQFTRFDGNLGALDLSELAGSVMSPTSLEAWADCPMRYLFKHVLGVQTAEQPEELVAISALEKGSLVHKALDKFMKEQLENSQVPPPGQSWSDEQRGRLMDIGKQVCSEAESKGLTGTPVYWHHDRGRIMADLDRFLREDNELRRERNVAPVASEMAFGIGGSKPGDHEAIEVDLPDGRSVRFRGQIDRVDQGEGGLLVTDYKTGKSDPYRSLDEDSKNWDPVQRGTRLQLPVYALAAQEGLADSDAPVRAQYWFVTGEQEFKACGYSLDESVLSRFRDALGTITEGIGAGVFCDRPQLGQTEGPYSQYCDFCNADRLGTEDRRRKWERMQHQAELAGYRNLAEPSEDDAHGKGD